MEASDAMEPNRDSTNSGSTPRLHQPAEGSARRNNGTSNPASSASKAPTSETKRTSWSRRKPNCDSTNSGSTPIRTQIHSCSGN